MFKPKDNLFELLVTVSQIGIYIIQDNRFKLINPEMIRITGYSKNELLRINPLELVLPEDRQIVVKREKKMLKEGKGLPYEFRTRTKDGSIKWILEMVAPIQFKG